MKLRTQIDLVAFLRQVRACRGEISFRSAQGDLLNLKSLLSGVVFAAGAQMPAFLTHGEVLCPDPRDAALLEDYLEEDSCHG